MDSASIGKAKL